MVKEIISLIILSSPVIWELFNDRKGDVHPNNDWIIRGLIMITGSMLVSLITYHTFWQSLIMSFGIFTLFFPYLYNILNKKKPWYNYLSKTAIPDKWEFWRITPWYGRMFVLLIIFLSTLMIYYWKYMYLLYPYGQ